MPRPNCATFSASPNATAVTGPSTTRVIKAVTRLDASTRRPPNRRSSQRKRGQQVDARMAAQASELMKGHNT